MEKNLKIGIDLDGVLANFVAGFITVVNSIFPGRLETGYNPPDWNFSDKLTLDELKQAFSAVHKKKNFWKNLLHYDNSVSILVDFLDRNSDVDVYYITARAGTLGDTVLAQTTYWLYKRALWPRKFRTSVIVVNNGPGKANVIRELEIQYSIDDHPETIVEMNKIPGHKAYLLDRPWNRAEAYKDLPRIKSLEEFLEIVCPKPKPKKHHQKVAQIFTGDSAKPKFLTVPPKMFYDSDTVDALKYSMNITSTKKVTLDSHDDFILCHNPDCPICTSKPKESYGTYLVGKEAGLTFNLDNGELEDIPF